MSSAAFRVIAAGFAAALLMLFAGPASAEWRRAESPHFVVYGDLSERALREYVQKLERLDAVFLLYYPAVAEWSRPKLHVYLANGGRDLRRISPGLSEQVAGFYLPSSNRTFAVANLRAEDNDRVLFHEYGHHFMFYLASAAYPAWFVEGFAEYYSTVDLTPGRIRLGLHSPGRMNSLTDRQGWLAMEDLLASTTRAQRNGHVFYAQSWALAHYFLSDPDRRVQLSAYLNTVAAGGDPVTAMQDATGRAPDQLLNDLQYYLSGRITYFTLTQAFPVAPVTVTTLPDSTGDLIWLDLRLDRGVPRDEVDTVVAEVRRITSRWPGDRQAALVLAKAEILAGNPAAAEAILAPLIANDTPDAEALLVTARALLKRADDLEDRDEALNLARQARRLLARAYQAEPMDYRILAAIDESRRMEAGYPNANDLDLLDTLVEMAPQVMGIRSRAAGVFMSVGDYDRVIRFISPVANNPHNREGAQAARDMLAQALALRAGLPPPAPTADTDEAGDSENESGEG